VPTFTRSILINAPVSAVFGFHERQDALALLTPPFPRVRVIHRTGGIEVGSSVELRVGFIRWIALHTAYERDCLFVDEQIEGPFARWTHRHEFEALAVGRLTDRVDYILPGGAAANALLGWAVKPGLMHMFTHRHRVTRQLCEAK
jgi:ligand-binding SRPBCC domain-containing protein